MACLTDKEIAEKQLNGGRMNRLNCGWRLSNEDLSAIILMLDKWNPETDVEKRDKRICYLAFVKNMNASQISRLNDPLLVGMGNRSRNKPLSEGSILQICYKYAPAARNRQRSNQKTARERISLAIQRKQGEINKPKICGVCGSTDELELHHIVPLSFGGTNDYYNLIYLCHTCHVAIHSNNYSKLKIPKTDIIE